MSVESLDLVEVVAKAKEYGPWTVAAWLTARYGGRLLDFSLNLIGIRLTRRQKVEDQVAVLSEDFAHLRGQFLAFSCMVADAADAMDEEMQASNIENRVLRVFIGRLKDAKRVSDSLARHRPVRDMATPSAPSPTPAPSAPPAPSPT